MEFYNTQIDQIDNYPSLDDDILLSLDSSADLDFSKSFDLDYYQRLIQHGMPLEPKLDEIIL
jgi:hypothetical protein